MSAPVSVQSVRFPEPSTVVENGRVVDYYTRCWRCRRPLHRYSARPWSKDCSKCNAPNGSAPEDDLQPA